MALRFRERKDWGVRILFTGSRHLKSDERIREALGDLDELSFTPAAEITFVHGGAIGADQLVDHIGRSWGVKVEAYPANWKRDGKSAGPNRNRLMVSKGADVCLAFPDPISKGTADCLNAAWRAGIKTLVYPVKI